MWADPQSKTEVQASADIFGTQLDAVGVSMKGNASLSDSGVKKSWKLDINAFVERQTYQNLAMILLHNNFADPSMLREKLGYDMLRFAGANSAFTRFVEVWIDVVDDDAPAGYWGVYTMVERPDRTYLANRFGGANNHGNLYKAYAWFEQGAADLAYYGEDIADYPMPRGRLAYGAKPAETDVDYSDIIELTRVIDGTQYATADGFATAVEEVLDVDSYLRYLAATFLHLNFDTYPYTGNNFYIYHNPGTDLFEFVAWDENSSWGQFPGSRVDFPIYGDGRSLGPLDYAPLFVKVFEVPRYRVTYEAYLDLLLRHWFNDDDFSGLVETYRSLLAPYIAKAGGDKMFFGPTAMFSPDEFHLGLDALVSLTTERARFVAQQLKAGSS